MASGHVNRTERPNTWQHRPSLDVKIPLANPEPSTHGTSRHFAVLLNLVAIGASRTSGERSAGQIYGFTPKPALPRLLATEAGVALRRERARVEGRRHPTRGSDEHRLDVWLASPKANTGPELDVTGRPENNRGRHSLYSFATRRVEHLNCIGQGPHEGDHSSSCSSHLFDEAFLANELCHGHMTIGVEDLDGL